MSFLEIKNMNLVAGEKTLLADISLTMEKGEVLGLIGESGAGKSTLGLAAIGFMRPGCSISLGEVKLMGKDLVTMSQPDLRQLRQQKVAYVAQSAAAAFNPFYRLQDQVTELRALQKDMTKSERREIARSLFERLQLPDPESFCSKYPHQTSGGQLQRAMIAMALLNDPELIVFDEPTTALDVTTQMEVLRVIRQVIADQGCAAIYVSHDLAVISQISDRILVLRNGRMVEQNSTRVIIEEPEQDYTQALVAHRKVGDFVGQPPAEASVIDARALDLGYGLVKIVNDVNLSISQGEIVALVGESGSGKTTVARSIAGLLPPWAGEILLDGETLEGNIDRRSDDIRRRIQFVHQLPDVALNPRQTIRVALARPLQKFQKLSGKALQDRLDQLMDEVELPRELLNRYPGALSGGQKQRICIARAIAADPEVIICDEVTSALDQIVQEGILKLLMKLQKELGITYIFITHDISTVKAISDEVVVMFQGKVVEQGLKSQIFSPPHPKYTELLLSSVPEMDPDWLSNLISSRN